MVVARTCRTEARASIQSTVPSRALPSKQSSTCVTLRYSGVPVYVTGMTAVCCGSDVNALPDALPILFLIIIVSTSQLHRTPPGIRTSDPNVCKRSNTGMRVGLSPTRRSRRNRSLTDGSVSTIIFLFCTNQALRSQQPRVMKTSPKSHKSWPPLAFATFRRSHGITRKKRRVKRHGDNVSIMFGVWNAVHWTRYEISIVG